MRTPSLGAFHCHKGWRPEGRDRRDVGELQGERAEIHREQGKVGGWWGVCGFIPHPQPPEWTGGQENIVAGSGEVEGGGRHEGDWCVKLVSSPPTNPRSRGRKGNIQLMALIYSCCSGIKHIEELLAYASHPPVVNQLELHPFCPQPAVASLCASHNILLQAYSPLIRARKMDDPTLVSVARAHNVTPAQVLLRWSLQKGWIPIPKSDDPERIRLNKELFGWALTEEEMKEIEKLGVGMEDGQGAVCPYLAHAL